MYGSVENLIETEVKGTPLADRLSDDQISQILAESSDSFAKPDADGRAEDANPGAPSDGPQTLAHYSAARARTHLP